MFLKLYTRKRAGDDDLLLVAERELKEKDIYYVT